LMRGEVGARDRLDATRSAAPMRPAPDAHVLDTGMLGIDQVVRTALDLWAAVTAARR
jgi:cytidylate kinase